MQVINFKQILSFSLCEKVLNMTFYSFQEFSALETKLAFQEDILMEHSVEICIKVTN